MTEALIDPLEAFWMLNSINHDPFLANRRCSISIILWSFPLQPTEFGWYVTIKKIIPFQKSKMMIRWFYFQVKSIWPRWNHRYLFAICIFRFNFCFPSFDSFIWTFLDFALFQLSPLAIEFRILLNVQSTNHCRNQNLKTIAIKFWAFSSSRVQWLSQSAFHWKIWWRHKKILV